MADGRMLKKQISRSKKLAALKTDSARMLYTWMIPHLDIEGRLEADPDIVKGEIVPRLTTFTPDNIQEYLEEMAEVGLIILYHYEGDQYLELVKFKDHQSLREGKEAKSRIPDKESSELLCITPGLLPEQDRTTPAKDKIREDKIREDNTTAPNDKPKKIIFNYQTQKWENLNGMVETWQERFPALDINIELNKMASWLEANPKNRKSNYQKFIVNWLVRAQDKAPAKGGKELW